MKSWPWIERAEGFWRTAEFVLYQEKYVGQEHFVPLFAPGVNFHISLELYMKAFLLAKGFTEEQLSVTKNYGHKLLNLYAAVVAIDSSLAGYEEPLTRRASAGMRCESMSIVACIGECPSSSITRHG